MERLTKKEKEISFSNWWYEVPLRDVRKIKKQIMERCYISRNVFHHWVEGNTEIPELALPIIEEIAGKKIFTKE